MEVKKVFQVFPQEMIPFFLDLRFHNDKAFMDQNRERYHRDVRDPFYAFILDLGQKMLTIDGDFEVRPHKCLSRINRDTRFTRDKSPYRDHLWLAFRRAGVEKDGAPFYWFEISPERVTWGLGIWGENRNLMDSMRRRMLSDPAAFERLLPCVEEAGCVMMGQTWKKMPVPPEIPPHLKSMYVARSIYFEKGETKLSWIYQKSIVSRVFKDFLALAPVYRMLRGCAE